MDITTDFDSTSKQALGEMFPGHDPEKVALAAGAVPGSHVEFRSVMPGVVGVDINHPHLKATRLFQQFGKGDRKLVSIIHSSQTASGPLLGDGYNRFHAAVGHLRDLGVKSIHVTSAEGEPGGSENGYYTWPRFGFQGQIPHDALERMPQELHDQLDGDHTFHKLFSLPGAAKYWKQHGQESTSLNFDLHPESDHSKAFNAYRQQRQAQTAARVPPGGDGGDQPGEAEPTYTPRSAAKVKGTYDPAAVRRLAQLVARVRTKNGRRQQPLRFQSDSLAQTYNSELNKVADQLHAKHGVADVDQFKSLNHYNNVLKIVKGDHDLAADTLNEMLYGQRPLTAEHKPGDPLGPYVGFRAKYNPAVAERSRAAARKTKTVSIADADGNAYDHADYRNPESDPTPFDVPEEWVTAASSKADNAAVGEKIGLTADKVELLRKLLRKRELKRLRAERGRPQTPLERNQAWVANSQTKTDDQHADRLLNYLQTRPEGVELGYLSNSLFRLPPERMRSLVKQIGAGVQFVSPKGVGKAVTMVYHPDHQVPRSPLLDHLNEVHTLRQQGLSLAAIGSKYGVTKPAVVAKLKSREKLLQQLAEFNDKPAKQSRQEGAVKFARETVRRPIHEILRGTRLAVVLKEMLRQGNDTTRGLIKPLLRTGELSLLGILHDHLDEDGDPIANQIRGEYDLRNAMRKLNIDRAVHPVVGTGRDDDVPYMEAMFIAGLDRDSSRRKNPPIADADYQRVRQAAEQQVPDVTHDELIGSLLRHSLRARDSHIRNRFHPNNPELLYPESAEKLHQSDIQRLRTAALTAQNSDSRPDKYQTPEHIAASQFKFARRGLTTGEVSSMWLTRKHKSGLNQTARYLNRLVSIHKDGVVRTLAASALRGDTTAMRALQDKLDEINHPGVNYLNLGALAEARDAEINPPEGKGRPLGTFLDVDKIALKSPARYAKGKNPEGGLTVAEARRQGIQPGSATKAAAEKAGGFGKIKGKTQKRRKSFCSRMCGTAKQHPKAANDPKSRLRKSLRIWGCRCKNSKQDEVVKFSTDDHPFNLPDDVIKFNRQPNPTRGNFLQALKRVQSRQQEQLRKLAEELYEKFDLTPVTVRDAIHSNGPVASANTAHAIYHDSDPELAKMAAAQYGLASQSPSLLLFHVGDDGPDALHKVPITGSGEGVLKRLDKHGLLQRTLIPTKVGYDVFLADRGSQLVEKVKQFASEMGSNVNSVRGVGELIGGGNDSTANGDNRSSYRQILSQYQSKQNGQQPVQPQVQPGVAGGGQVQS